MSSPEIPAVASHSGAIQTDTTQFADQVKLFSEHIKGILTLSSASLPVIVALLGQLVGKDSQGRVVVPAFVKAGMPLVVLSLSAFLLSILTGVGYSFVLCLKVGKPQVRMPSLDILALATHVFFGAGVVLFFAWIGRMIVALP